MATLTPEGRIHPMDLIQQALAKYSAPSRADGLTSSERIALPAMQQSLRAAELSSQRRFGSTMHGMRG